MSNYLVVLATISLSLSAMQPPPQLFLVNKAALNAMQEELLTRDMEENAKCAALAAVLECGVHYAGEACPTLIPESYQPYVEGACLGFTLNCGINVLKKYCEVKKLKQE